MKKGIIITTGVILAVAISAFLIPSLRTPEPKIRWYTFEEAVKANEKVKKKMFIDVYTDWCGWCKTMDRETFQNDAVVDYIQKNFYPVKLNAEQKEDIVFGGQTFKFVASGRGGVNTFAYSLLDGHLSYPTAVYLNENYERILISPGYKKSDMMMNELKFTAEERYKNTSWEDYLNGK